MKVKIKFFNGDLPNHFIGNKEYDLFQEKIHGIIFNEIISEDARIRCINFENCEHLNGGSWEIVE